MPIINILKTDKPVCDGCGKTLEGIYCEITLDSEKVIKMHRECAIDFAVNILAECNKDKDLKEVVNRKIVESSLDETTPKEEVLPPHARFGVDECGEYVYYDVIDHGSCYGCNHFCDNYKEERFECSEPYCYRRDNTK